MFGQRFTAASKSDSVFSNWPDSEMWTIAVIWWPSAALDRRA